MIGDIQFSAGFASQQTIDLALALPTITGNVNLFGPGADLLTVRRNTGGDYSVFSIGAGGKATLSGLTLANGHVDLGGGINNAGTLALARVTLDTNTATSSGGGVYNTGSLAIEDSTISNNTAVDGGGLYNTTSGTASVTNTTISGNTATSYTAAITNIFGRLVTLTNSTIANNTGVTEDGIYTASATTRLKNSIVTNQSKPTINTDGVDPATFVTSLGNNLVSDGGGGFLTGSGDIINRDAFLAPLAYNGGPTRTHALQTGSPAANAGNAFAAPIADQRGVSRPVGSGIDIGAFESDVLFRGDFELP